MKQNISIIAYVYIVFSTPQIDFDDLNPDFLEEQPPSRMLVLRQFDQPQEYAGVVSGWVFTCKSELMNLRALLQCPSTSANGLYLSGDGTYKLTNNGWVMLNLISETVIDSEGGKCCTSVTVIMTSMSVIND